jgi:polyhydroxyalkanoate synthesis regulator phasin
MHSHKKQKKEKWKMVSQEDKNTIAESINKSTEKLLKDIATRLDNNQREFHEIVDEMVRQRNNKMNTYFATKLSALQNDLSDLSLALLEVSELHSTEKVIDEIEKSILIIDKRINQIQDKVENKEN